MTLKSRFFSLIALVAVSTSTVFAGGGTAKTYYSTLTTISTGAGKVYTSASETNSPTYEISSLQMQNSSTTDASAKHTYHVYAQTPEGYSFGGWFNDASCTNLFNTQEHTTFQLTATSEDKNAPTEGYLWAKFDKIIVNYYSTYTVHNTNTEAGEVYVSNAKIATPDYQSETASASLFKNDQRHPYYLYAKAKSGYMFSGWYSDAECTELLSTNREYIHNASVESTSETSPTEIHAYAKFEVNNMEYQIRNASFEDWEDVPNGQEPVDWSSFLTLRGSGFVANQAKKKQLEPSTEAHDGTYSAKIWARSVVGVIAQGNLTTGCINAGSTTAADANGNYNFTQEETEGQHMLFKARPDAMKVWIKANTSRNFKIAAYLHTKGYFQDPIVEERNSGVKVIAQATAAPESNGGVWTEYTVPFEYNDATDRPYYALISFATSATPGQGAASDEMYIDDIRLEYHSQLRGGSYNGKSFTFDGNNSAEIDFLYDDELLTLDIDGAGANVMKNFDESTHLLTITVEGEDISQNPTNTHTYTIQFSDKENNIIDGDNKYAINFDKEMLSVRNDRELTSISLTSGYTEPQTFDIDPGHIYTNLSELDPEVVFLAAPGSAINVEFGYNNDWMHGYAYIDLENDGAFDVVSDPANKVVSGDIMGYSFYSFIPNNDERGYNSDGQLLTDNARATRTIPTFYAPEDYGDYQMRLKIDWNSIDPAGSLGSEGSVTGKDGIATNGGYIVDIILRVVTDPTGIHTTTLHTSGAAIYDLQGRQQQKATNGIYLKAGRKYIVK